MPGAFRIKPDVALARDQLQALQTMLKSWGVEVFCSMMFWILTKEEVEFVGAAKSRLVPFKFNRIQKYHEQRLARNNRIVKARQVGFTTYNLIRRLLLQVIMDYGKAGLLISQNNEYAEKHLQIAARAYRYIGALDPKDDKANELNRQLKANLLHTTYSNRRELVFDILDSKLMIASAEVEEAAQGVTLHHIVASEVARWPRNPEATLSNVRGALVPGGTLDEESTANGAAGYFYEQCLRALDDETKADARLHFYPWYWTEEYRIELSAKEKKELEADLEADERQLREKFYLELEQIRWRRLAKIEQRGNFDEKYPEDVLTAFLVSGQQYFDREILLYRKRELVHFAPFQTFSNGDARIFHPRIPGRRYLIGADCATGRTVSSDNTDYCAGVVIDMETGEEMAAYRAKVTPQDFAYDLADLGRYFNDAVISVERTGDGGTCILTLQGECKYAAVYKHKEWWRRQRTKVIEVDGFPTTTKTRPIALNFLNRFVIEHPELIWDEQFLNEALTFVRDPKGKPAAASGAHDDTVSARWVAAATRMALLGYWLPTEARKEKYIAANQLEGVEPGGYSEASSAPRY